MYEILRENPPKVIIDYLPTGDTDPLHPLWVQYHGQTGPQPAHIELNIDAATISAGYNANIGPGMSFRVWHKRDLQWSIPAGTTAKDINAVMDAIKDDCQTTINHSIIQWDGSNHIGRFDQTAQEAIERITQTIEAHTEPSTSGVWNASDWLQNAVSIEDNTASIDDVYTITEHTADTELEKIAAELEQNARYDDVTLVGTLDYLQDLRRQATEQEAE